MRHEKLHACTICYKVFGSKSDWKRHEGTQHFLIEAWRCHEPNVSNNLKVCGKAFWRREMFHAHLQEQHHIKDDKILREKTRQHRVGRNGQGAFWYVAFHCRILVLQRLLSPRLGLQCLAPPGRPHHMRLVLIFPCSYILLRGFIDDQLGFAVFITPAHTTLLRV